MVFGIPTVVSTLLETVVDIIELKKKKTKITRNL